MLEKCTKLNRKLGVNEYQLEYKFDEKFKEHHGMDVDSYVKELSDWIMKTEELMIIEKLKESSPKALKRLADLISKAIEGE